MIICEKDFITKYASFLMKISQEEWSSRVYKFLQLLTFFSDLRPVILFSWASFAPKKKIFVLRNLEDKYVQADTQSVKVCDEFDESSCYPTM